MLLPSQGLVEASSTTSRFNPPAVSGLSWQNALLSDLIEECPMRRVRLIVITLTLVAAVVEAQRAAPRGEWRHYAGDAASTKYSPLDQIARANVRNLQVAWRWSSPDNAIVQANPTTRPGAYQDTPLMVNGVLYTETSLGVFVAIDPTTGRTLWQYDPEIWKAGRPPNLGFTHRGVAYWTDGTTKRIISGTHDANLISLDAETGKPDPAFGVNGRVDVIAGLPYAERVRNYAINSTPVVVKNVIIAGANINDGPVVKEQPRGDIFGFDVKTGKKLWTFHSVPQAGEFGHETWENGSADYTGGTNVWSMITVDEALGYVYLPFGTPTNDYYGGHRLGANLFAESLVCLDATTGKRVWHFQGVHHGLWDYDFPAAPILVDITVNGRRINAVAQVSKQAFVYVFDRRTGAPVWPIEERPGPQSSAPDEKTTATQPFPTKPPAFDRQGLLDDDVIDFTPELKAQALQVLKQFDRGPLFTPPSLKGTVQMPGNVGGADWGGAAVDPSTATLFVPSLTSPIIDQLVKGDPARGNMAYRRGGVGNLPTLDGLPLYKPPYSRVTAYDLNTGTIKWQVPIGDGPRNHPLLKELRLGPLGNAQRGNPLATATLLFVSQASGGLGRGESLKVGERELTPQEPEPPRFRAFDKATGELVWEFELPLGPAASPMTYLYGGRQYIVMAIGGGLNAELVALALPR
jgi:glucose dehydrogenase